MYKFDYHRPSSLNDAAKLFSGAGDPKFMSGGQTLIPTMKQRLAAPSDVIDLGGLAELKGITVSGGVVTIGAGTRHEAVQNSAEVAKAIPALADLAGMIGDPAVRHRGTIGGSIANADPSADYPAAVVALNATVHTTKRTITADAFFTGMFETALEPGEIVTKIAFPVPEKAGYEKFRNPASRYAMVGVFVAKTAGGVRVAVTGAAPSVFRQSDMEAALAKRFSADAVAGVKQSADGMNADLHGSAEYRAHLVTVMAKRAVAKAVG
ncbi:MAG: xanthine dehydrogenase family protein subunit M [Alphaproteobacteria bacterium]|nr:xanthine dehydrogenase family protein subunit M [Alphaproteobacteria bacterium]